MKGKPTSAFGERLRLARALHGMTQRALGDVVSAGQDMISRVERGDLQPSESLKAALAHALGFKLEFFDRPLTDEYRLAECSFRHLQSTPRRDLDRAMALGTLFQEVVIGVRELVELPANNLPSLPFDSEDAAERAANEARLHWGLGLRAPIVNMMRVAENAGVLVARLPGASRKVDAFSRPGSPPVVVLTSTKDSPVRERHDVAHELGHLTGHQGRETGDLRTERQANRFASAFLLPADGFAAEFRMLGGLDWPNLFELKRRWKVAGPTMLSRAEQLGLIDPVNARRLYKQHSWKGWNRVEPFDVPAEEPELLTEALRIAEQDTGHDLRMIAAELGWLPPAAGDVVGLPLKALAPRVAANVKRIEDYR